MRPDEWILAPLTAFNLVLPSQHFLQVVHALIRHKLVMLKATDRDYWGDPEFLGKGPNDRFAMVAKPFQPFVLAVGNQGFSGEQICLVLFVPFVGLEVI